MRRILRYAARKGNEFASFLRRLRCGLLYPDIRIERGAFLSRGAMLATYDGGSIAIGRGTIVGRNALIEAKGGHVGIGRDGLVNDGTIMVATNRIAIGHHALIAEYATIRDQDHRHDGDAVPYADQGRDDAPIMIGDNVWLGAKVTVTKGVTIGEGAIVGANAVVTHDLEAGGKYGGVPARPMKKGTNI